MGSKKTKADLIAENEALRSRVAELEREVNPWADGSLTLGSKGPPHGKAGQAKRTMSDKTREPTKTLATPIPVLLAYVDADQRLQYNNQSYVDWFGGQRRNAEGKHIKEVLGDSNYQKILPRIQAALAGEEQAFELEVPGSDGETRIVQTHYVPHLGKNRAVLGFDATVVDITEHRRAEEALRESGEQFRAITDAMPALISFVDSERKYRFVNSTYEEWFGKTADEFIGHYVWDVHGKQGYEHLRPYIDLVLSGNPTTFETVIPNTPKGDRAVFGELFPNIEESGYVNGYFVMTTDITERKEAEEALRESEARLEKTLASLSDALFVVDPRTRKIVSCNPAVQQVFGYNEQEILGRNTEVLHKDKEAYEEFGRNLFPALDRQGWFRFENKMRRKDGSVFDSDHSVTEIRDESGERTAVISIVRDITERKLTEKALAESEEKYRSLVELSPSAVLVQQSGKIVFANSSALEMYRADGVDQLLGKRTVDLVPPEYRKKMLEVRRKLQDGEIMKGFSEYKRLRLDGTTFFGEGIGTQITYNDEDAFLIVIRDNTERKKAEADLKESHILLQTIFDNVPHWLWIKDQEGRYKMVNRSLADFFKSQPRDWVGKKFRDFETNDDEISSSHKSDHAVIETNKMVDIHNMKSVSADGTTIIYHVIKLPLRDHDGNAIGIVGISEDITERNRAEEEVLNSQRLLQTIFDTIPHPLYVKDSEGRLLMANKSWSDYFETSAEQAIGNPLAELQGPSEVEISEFRASDEAVFSTGKEFEKSEQSITSPSGKVRYFHIRKSPIFDEAERVQGLVGISVDISERKHAEDALKESEERFRAAIDNSPSMISVKDLEGRFLIVNRRNEEWFGVAPSQFIGKTSYDLFPREIADRIVAQDRAVVELKKVDEQEIEVTLPDGSRRLAINTKFPLFDHEKKVIGIGAITTDITEKRQAEIALQESEELFRNIMKYTPSSIFIKDMEGRYKIVNPQYEQWIGLNANEMIGKTTADIMSGEVVETFKTQDQEVIKTGKPVEWEIDVPVKGEIRRIVNTKFPVFNSNGKQVAIGTINTDITEKKMLEDQLRQAQKMEALGTLAGGIAHDFNNILSPILGYSELMLKNANLESRELDYLNTIFRSAIRAKDLVSQILLFSRRGRSEKLIIDLSPIVEEVVKFMRSTLPTAISVQQRISGDVAPVFCNLSQMHQMILNLCVNAGQAMTGIGNLKITLNIVELDGFKSVVGKILSGKHVRLSVTDTGIGMDNETLSQIFDPFFTTKEIGEGTGLGLSTVFGIVQDHEGGINVSSEPGQGTTFEIYLPATEQPIETPTAIEAMVPKGGESILFIDDEQAIAEMGKNMLEDYGYKVTISIDSREALKMFKANPNRFDLVVTDQGMPNLMGDQLAEKMRQARADIPIILCTGHSKTMTPESSKAVGINAFLYKPIQMLELGEVIRKVLDEAEQAETSKTGRRGRGEKTPNP